MLPLQTDVLIVGAGPTGLALATALQQSGVDHLLVDALEYAQNTSRAGVVHPHTLEVLEMIGVTTPLSAEGTTVTDFTVRDRDQPLLGVSYAALPSAFRHMLLLPQSTTEAVLQAQLESLGGAVHRSVAALRVTTDANGTAVQVKTAEGERTVHAHYVVGADGMHSVIREAAGIAFQGTAYGESFVLADVCMDWPMGNSEVSLFFSPAGLVVVAPLPDGSYRVVATVDDAPDVPGIDLIQQLLDTRGPVAKPAHVTDMVWSSRFRVHHRLAETYRKGPILLMGDAAHVHSPAGGQGMNAGLVDAIVLGDALTRVVRDGAPDSVLDDYAATRRPAAQLVLGLASRLTRMATVRSALGRRVRNVVLRILNRIPPFKRNLSLALSGISRRKYSVLPDRKPLETPFAPAPCSNHPPARGGAVMSVRTIQWWLAAVFVVLGGWCLVSPGSVLALTITPTYQSEAPIVPILIGAFGAQALIAGLFAAFSRFEQRTFLAYGIGLLPFFVFDYWFYVVVPMLTWVGLLDVVGNVVMMGACVAGWRAAGRDI